LLLLVIREIEERDDFPSLETIVHDSFTKYPKKFGFKKYPQWPDSHVVEKRLRDMRRPKGLLSGNNKLGYRLTEAGQYRARVAFQRVTHPGAPKPEARTFREPEHNLVRLILESNLYQAYTTAQNETIFTNDEVFDFLKLPLEAPLRIVIQKVKQFRNIVKGYPDTVSAAALGQFLESLEDWIGSNVK
jgi:hypothetical protein